MKENQTKIICTLGPASDQVPILSRLLQAGMQIGRLNFSFGEYHYFEKLIKNARVAEKKTGLPFTLLQDLGGPKMRVGDLGEAGLELIVGQIHSFYFGVKLSQAGAIPVSYSKIATHTKPGDRLLLDDGSIELEAIGVKGKTVQARVMSGGHLISKKGLNLPDSKIQLNPLTDKDKADLKFGVQAGVDWICLSFVDGAECLEEARTLVAKAARLANLPPPKIMAKIERSAALEKLPQIIAAADGLLLGRGDLGLEIPYADVPLIQKDLAEKARLAGLPLIVATHMLESMRNHPRATRAEVSDIANAVFDGVDAVMLSAETAIGEFPVAAVKTMQTVIREAEQSRFAALPLNPESVDCLPSSLAFNLALLDRQNLLAGVVALGHNALPPAFVNLFRLKAPLIVVVDSISSARQALLFRGAYPVIMPAKQTSFQPSLHSHLKKQLALKSNGQYLAYLEYLPKQGARLSFVPV